MHDRRVIGIIQVYYHYIRAIDEPHFTFAFLTCMPQVGYGRSKTVIVRLPNNGVYSTCWMITIVCKVHIQT